MDLRSANTALTGELQQRQESYMRREEAMKARINQLEKQVTELKGEQLIDDTLGHWSSNNNSIPVIR